MDLIERSTRERVKKFYKSNPQIKNVKLTHPEGEIITCECGNQLFKLYKKMGGIVLGKYNRVVKDNPVIYNYFCKCGRRQILKEGSFGFAKIKYGCSAGKCIYGKNKMDKDCLSCKYIFEK